MRLLIDNCLPRWLAHQLTLEGHDVVWVGDWGADPGDERIFARAATEKRVIVTLDLDFGKLIVAALYTRAGILLMRKTRPTEWFDVSRNALEVCEAELRGGAIVIATPERLRVRRVPDRE